MSRARHRIDTLTRMTIDSPEESLTGIVMARSRTLRRVTTLIFITVAAGSLVIVALSGWSVIQSNVRSDSASRELSREGNALSRASDGERAAGVSHQDAIDTLDGYAQQYGPYWLWDKPTPDASEDVRAVEQGYIKANGDVASTYNSLATAKARLAHASVASGAARALAHRRQADASTARSALLLTAGVSAALIVLFLLLMLWARIGEARAVAFGSVERPDPRADPNLATTQDGSRGMLHQDAIDTSEPIDV
jgi:hypothetical protein